MKILFIIFLCLFVYYAFLTIINYIIVKKYIGYIPHVWYYTIKDNDTLIIHHNGLRSSYCIDEGDEIIDLHEEFKVNKFTLTFIKINYV